MHHIIRISRVCYNMQNNHAYRIRGTEFSYTKARQFRLDEFICSHYNVDHAYVDIYNIYMYTEFFKNILYNTCVNRIKKKYIIIYSRC